MIEETFLVLLEISLLLAHCYGSTGDCDTVIVQQGEMANLTFNFSKDISVLRYNFHIQRFDLNNKYRDLIISYVNILIEDVNTKAILALFMLQHPETTALKSGTSDSAVATLSRVFIHTVLHCFWIDEKELHCQQLKGFFIDVNVTSILWLKINQTSKDDSGIYECSVISNGGMEVVCKLSVIVQDTLTTTLVTSASKTTANSSFSENVDEGQCYNHFIPVVLGTFVLCGAVVLILRIIFPNVFKYCKCHHSDKNMEIDQREGTNETFDVEDTNELNCGEEQHQLRKKNNTTATLDSVAMPFNNTLNNGDMILESIQTN